MIWVAGKIVADHALTIGARDRTFEHGLGLFETLRTWNGRALLLDRHLARLRSSAKELGIPIDSAFLPDDNSVRALLEANGVQDDLFRHLARLRRSANELGIPIDSASLPDDDSVRAMLEAQGSPDDVLLRITLTGGWNEVDGATLWMRLGPLPAPRRHEGAVVDLGSWQVVRDDPIARHKTLNYWARRQVFETARAIGYDEVLSSSEDWFVWEGSRTNLFLVSGDALITPSLDGPIVPGIMRGVVIEQGERLAMTVVTKHDVVREQLLTADEVFLTNSVRGIIPVARIGERTWPAPGDWTHRLMISVNDWLREQGGTPA
jgi:branched-subunit amino acid aminotransferase/4-amino-4-deoxychorismate lyase